MSTTEVKGLDIKLREYRALSKDVSNCVLDQILSGEATEVVVEKIHEFLTSLGTHVRAGKLATQKFIIHKRLGKRHEDYRDAKSQAAWQRAFHPDELRRSGNADEKDKLNIDFEFYISNQILPPIERLCDPIDGTDRARLAECLGLDANKYQTYASGEQEERPFGTLESQVPDKERFKQCEPFRVKCRSCKKVFRLGRSARRRVLQTRTRRSKRRSLSGAPANPHVLRMAALYIPPTDYDVRMLFLSAFLAEITLLHERFLHARRSSCTCSPSSSPITTTTPALTLVRRGGKATLTRSVMLATERRTSRCTSRSTFSVLTPRQTTPSSTQFVQSLLPSCPASVSSTFVPQQIWASGSTTSPLGDCDHMT
ncbi:hypothetical protein EXIGLDRAFT_758619 [Exidia glandulosa HHB12029]|uniref:DNA-directed DNA polymerase n=1 Tax=Exidia glandulosa HHB12029 TaxID=1314781 RepID=A0A165R0L0_EXIGL|nr:hypothetical protein EXIGLDRAFT_758619 [Exidia glandulosa HHB12029]